MMSDGALSSIPDILLKKPVVWLAGLFAGLSLGGVLLLGMTGNSFISGKLVFLAAVLFPFFIAGTDGCLSSGEFTLQRFLVSGRKFFFPILLPLLLLGITIMILVLLLSIPFSLINPGDQVSIIASLLIGVSIPACIFSLFLDNVAVTEETNILHSLGRSRDIVRSEFITVLLSLVIVCFVAAAFGFLMMMAWGTLLYDKFSAYEGMSYTELKEVFSGFTPTDLIHMLGLDGVYISTALLFLYTLVMTTIVLVYKHQIYIRIKTAIPQVIGEYDEKGRWYKY